MTHKRITRSASDNEYLHKDFHGALSNAIQYLHREYGSDAVREYLQQFTRNFYASLNGEIQNRGLEAIQEHYLNIYDLEGGNISTSLANGKLTIRVPQSPAVQHMRDNDYEVAELFHETIRTVNETLCEDTPYLSRLDGYDPETGACTMVFWRDTS